MIVEEEIYLEHYGKKGMRWGKRQQKTKTLSKAQRKKRNVDRVHKATKVVSGALFVASVLASSNVGSNVGARPSGKIPIKNLTKSSTPVKTNLADVIRAQESQRNGAFRLREQLKRMGEDVI